MTGTYTVCLWTIFCLYLPFYVLATPVPHSDVKNPEDRATLGGLTSVNVSDENVKKAAYFAVSQIYTRDSSFSKLVLKKILSAKKQTVAGVLYYLKLEIGLSNCSIGEDDANLKCSVNEDSNNKICDVQVWERAWLNKTELTAASCSPVSSRQTQAEDRAILGGVVTVNVSDKDVKKAADFAVVVLNERGHSIHKLVLVKILSAKKQIVAGWLYYLQLEVTASNCSKGKDDANLECSVNEDSNNKICDVQVSERLWLNKTELIKVSCHPKSSITLQEENPAVPGGLVTANVSDENVKKAAAFAVKRISDRENSLYRLVLVKILSAKTQVVEGVVYYLQLEVATSNCRKGKDDARLNCSVKEDSIKQLCDVQVWDRPWLNNTMELSQMSCSPILLRQTRTVGIPGYLSDTDVNDDYIKNTARFAVQQVDKRPNSVYSQKFVRIVSTQPQEL